jgi:CDP-diacylglycerol---serine O-phosphatidyltransferase
VSTVTAHRESTLGNADQAPAVCAGATHRESTVANALQAPAAHAGADPSDPGAHPAELSLVEQLTLANLLTTASLCAGLAALFAATRTGVGMPGARIPVVLGLILLAVAFDAVDGPVARRSNSTGRFGGMLDSHADIVSFGVAPSMLAYFSTVHRIPVAGALSCVLFCACAAWRLARFQVCSHSRWFVGCPVPLAAVIAGLVAALGPSAFEMMITVGTLSCLMVGVVPFPTWSAIGWVVRSHRDRPRERGCHLCGDASQS